MIGEQIGNFRVVSRLGRGGMGEVYLAEQVKIGTKVMNAASPNHSSPWALTTVANGVPVVGGTSIAANPAGTFLFVSDSASGDISVFSISPTNGSLTAVGSPFPSGIAAAQLATDGLGNYLYATAGLGGAQVAPPFLLPA